MMVRELLMEILLIKIVRLMSTKMYIFTLFTKALQGGDTARKAVLHKSCCRTCG